MSVFCVVPPAAGYPWENVLCFYHWFLTWGLHPTDGLSTIVKIQGVILNYYFCSACN